VVVGKARQGDSKVPTPNLNTSIRVKYQQGDWNQSLFKATASVLHFCGKSEAASSVSNAAPTVQYLPREKAILSLRDRIKMHAPAIGGVVAFNQHRKRRKMNRISLHAMKLCRESFEWICGKHGVGGIEMALRFDKPDKTEKRYTRTMLKNW
jgi:hypothetical protein